MVRNPPANAGDLGLIPGLGRSPGEGPSSPLQYSCLKNPKDQRRLAGYSPQCHKESDTTEVTQNACTGNYIEYLIITCQFSSVAQACLTLCNPMDCSTPGFPVHHQLLELAQTHVHRVSDAIQPSHPLSSPSPALNLSQHQGIFQ